MKIIGIDYPCIDMGVVFEEIPEDGKLSEMLDSSLMGGGKVSNALVTVARLGAEAGIIGAVGSDSYGKKCIEDFKMNGVDTSHLHTNPGHTAFCLCLTDTATRGKRCIERPASCRRLAPEDIDEQYMQDASILLLYEMEDVAVEAAKIVKKHGVKVLVDGDEYDKRTEDNMGLVDIFIMSEYYYSALFKGGDMGNNLASILAKGPETVIVTLGKRGCAGVSCEGYFEMPTFDSVKVVDTLGAGDVFHGAFAYFYSKGFSPKEAARRASAVSSIKCTRSGGRVALPTLNGVEMFLETGVINTEDFDVRADFYRRAAY